MANTVRGNIKAIGDFETLTARNGTTYTRQSILLDNGYYSPSSGERFDNDLKLDFINLKEGDIRQRFSTGRNVEVSFRLRGFMYTDKYGLQRYGVSANCYRIDLPPQPTQQFAAQQPMQPQQPTQPIQQTAQPTQATQAAPSTGESADDLPF